MVYAIIKLLYYNVNHLSSTESTENILSNIIDMRWLESWIAIGFNYFLAKINTTVKWIVDIANKLENQWGYNSSNDDFGQICPSLFFTKLKKKTCILLSLHFGEEHYYWKNSEIYFTLKIRNNFLLNPIAYLQLITYSFCYIVRLTETQTLGKIFLSFYLLM